MTLQQAFPDLGTFVRACIDPSKQPFLDTGFAVQVCIQQMVARPGKCSLAFGEVRFASCLTVNP